MSLIRWNRSGCSQGAGKSRRKKTAPAPRREWDNTISDLSVHRPSPEELARRYQNRVSRNRAEAEWELRHRAAGHRRGKAAGKEPLVMTELLLDQRQLRDVLARSDRALALVRDLFGDAPRRQAGFPNVTAAPGCEKAPSAGLVAPRCEQPTQLSLLSESVMDSQALNETGDTTSDRQLSDESVEEADAPVSMDYQSNIDSNGRFPDRKQQKTPQPIGSIASSQSLGLKTPETPCTPSCASGNHTGLNATAAIQRVKSRVQSGTESNTELDGSSQFETARGIQQVLHPSSGNSKKGISKDNNCSVSTKNMGDSRQEDKQLSLEVLQEMIENIDQEMVEYERQTGRKVTGWSPQRGHSLTGFTFSLVSLISRLAHYLKENEIRQQQEKENQQQLLEKSKEQRALIDALTAEFLTMQNEIISVQTNLHQYMIKTDEELFLLKQMLHGSIEAERSKPKPSQSIDAHEVKETAAEGGTLHSCVYSVRQDKVNAPILRAVPNTGEKLFDSLEKIQPLANQYKAKLLEIAGRGQSLPEQLFGPAVLLSPPRQRNSQVPTGSQTTINLFQEKSLSNNVYLKSNDAHSSQIHKEVPVSPGVLKEGKDFTEYLGTQNQNQLQEYQDLTQQSKFWDANKVQKNLSLTFPVTNLPQMHEMQQPGTINNTTTCILRTKENNMEVKRGQDLSLDKWLKHEAMLSQITELQLQNSALKAHLSQFKMGKLSNSAPQIEKTIPSTCESLQQRITELNHQSAEARSKLLKLIEQQRQVSGDSASPPISPIPPEGIWTETGNKTLDVLIPLPNGLDSSTGTTPSPVSRTNRNRSTDNASTTSSSLHLDNGDENRAPVPQRMKPERLKEEGWFALSTHTM
ncbi:spindle and centriole-associated protein 1 [Heterodontus francisci]|uniref:spindle and centriole-associated protein 1 n=1 Tax=Heterodontus francisci TaxID=7792 RepID=UPI00355AEFE8